MCSIQFYFHSKVPNTNHEWTQITEDFHSKWNFPNCLDALDGKHIALRCPNNSGSMNFNYKHTFSIVLMGLADANYNLTYIDVGCKGRISDGGIFNRSTLYRAIERDSLNIPLPTNLPGSNIKAPYVIVADDAFALKSYLMKPYNFRGQDLGQRVFNLRLSRARRMIESVFGIMAAKFRILRTTMELSEENVKRCTLAICVLHNFLLKTNRNAYLTSEENIEDYIDQEPSVPNEERNISNDAKRVRENYKNYFMSSSGELLWQYDRA